MQQGGEPMMNSKKCVDGRAPSTDKVVAYLVSILTRADIYNKLNRPGKGKNTHTHKHKPRWT
jgi:hypothetical protein